MRRVTHVRRHIRTRPGRRLVLTAGFALALALTGCSTTDGSGGDGAREVTVGHLTVTVPAGWSEEEPDGTWDRKFAGDGVELQIAGTFSEDPTASAARARLDLPATVELPGYESRGIHEPPVEVAGADTSLRTDFTYEDEGTTKEGAWVIAGQWPYPSTAAIALSGESLDVPEVESVIESLTFTKTSGEQP